MPCSGLVIFLQNLYRFSPTIDISFEIFRTLGQGISKLGSGERKGMWMFRGIVTSANMKWMKYDLARL